MASDASGFLVLKRPDGYGDVHPLAAKSRCKVGRAADNQIVLRDDMCSRHHAEVGHGSNGWSVQDLNSLNGCFVNGVRVRGSHAVQTGDTVRFGRTDFVFVPSLDRLPAHTGSPDPATDQDDVKITRRATRTRFFPQPPPPASDQTVTADLPPTTHRLSPTESVAVLYRLAVDMATAQTPAELAELVIEAAFTGTPTEVAAVLALKDGGDLDIVAHRFRRGGQLTYHKVSNYVSREVLSSKQAVIAENVASDVKLRDRESVTELKATSLICAPVSSGDRVLGLLHLYCTGERGALDADDLEFALAAARQLGVVWDRFRNRAGLAAENQSLKAQLRLESELVGSSEPLRRVEQQVARVAGTKTTILIRGESGVGKELVARALHFSSPRKDRPLICLNCAAITESLMESELFGHEKGAFTGATERLIGKFEAADGGTLFLDEIGEMTAGAQAKLLRVLEGQAFERVGGNAPIKVDVRVVAATNRPLENAVRDGRFRTDLYYRLQVVQIDVPPLRDRPDDVPPIADHFLKRFARETGRRVSSITPAAIKKLKAHSWPGNVRELRNVIERAVALGTNPVIDEADIWLSPLDLETGGGAEYEPIPLADIEQRHILRTLEHTGWNKTKAAEILGIERSTLDRKIKAYDLRR
jgi:transcriptional regulator with GAF, ATPase, and Fis domain